MLTLAQNIEDVDQDGLLDKLAIMFNCTHDRLLVLRKTAGSVQLTVRVLGTLLGVTQPSVDALTTLTQLSNADLSTLLGVTVTATVTSVFQPPPPSPPPTSSSGGSSSSGGGSSSSGGGDSKSPKPEPPPPPSNKALLAIAISVPVCGVALLAGLAAAVWWWRLRKHTQPPTDPGMVSVVVAPDAGEQKAPATEQSNWLPSSWLKFE
ncbi:hypothetical protein T492DRAFT_80688 [Pavlovales sp. CCMP2436]|nr:hypothetical protein T492DRAFT_80688 [Pavlovales sp. CCMP2436]